ncbi:MAG: DNA replication/repair protein RecF [Ruminococcaceae bacterium]|nr:DNA replication/repair protein RecF [Oscillospiraceae bacterium]
MICKRISLENFRNIEKAELEFCNGTNILLGENAQGKTNLIEAIYYTALCRSFRQGTDKDLIRFGCEYSKIDNTYCDSIREMNTSVTLFSDRRQKRIEQNGLKISKMSDMVGAFKVVLFCPEHLSIVKEGPSMRRSFLDVAISQIRPLYMKSLQRYQTILKERNSLIKKAQEDRETFDLTVDVWSEQLAVEAAKITAYRVEYLCEIRKYVSDIFSDMTGKREEPEFSYISSCKLPEEELCDVKKVEDSFRELYFTRHDREIGAEATLWGTHKDDIEIKLNGNSARIFCSQGQQRSLSLAMKLSEGEIIKKNCGGEYPVFLLDDVLSELDGARRRYLISNLTDKQVIMTTCEATDISGANVIGVKEGKYFENTLQ